MDLEYIFLFGITPNVKLLLNHQFSMLKNTIHLQFTKIKMFKKSRGNSEKKLASLPSGFALFR